MYFILVLKLFWYKSYLFLKLKCRARAMSAYCMYILIRRYKVMFYYSKQRCLIQLNFCFKQAIRGAVSANVIGHSWCYFAEKTVIYMFCV